MPPESPQPVGYLIGRSTLITIVVAMALAAIVGLVDTNAAAHTVTWVYHVWLSTTRWLRSLV